MNEKSIRFCILIYFITSINFLFCQNECYQKVDSIGYYIFSEVNFSRKLHTKIDTIEHRSDELTIRNYIGNSKINFFNICKSKLHILSNELRDTFDNQNQIYQVYNFSDYSVQIINLIKNGSKITFGHLNLKKDIKNYKKLMCKHIRLVLDGGESFISFAYDWERKKMLYFRPNKI